MTKNPTNVQSLKKNGFTAKVPCQPTKVWNNTNLNLLQNVKQHPKNGQKKKKDKIAQKF